MPVELSEVLSVLGNFAFWHRLLSSLGQLKSVGHVRAACVPVKARGGREPGVLRLPTSGSKSASEDGDN